MNRRWRGTGVTVGARLGVGTAVGGRVGVGGTGVTVGAKVGRGVAVGIIAVGLGGGTAVGVAVGAGGCVGARRVGVGLGEGVGCGVGMGVAVGTGVDVGGRVGGAVGGGEGEGMANGVGVGAASGSGWLASSPGEALLSSHISDTSANTPTAANKPKEKRGPWSTGSAAPEPELLSQKGKLWITGKPGRMRACSSRWYSHRAWGASGWSKGRAVMLTT